MNWVDVEIILLIFLLLLDLGFLFLLVWFRFSSMKSMLKFLNKIKE